MKSKLTLHLNTEILKEAKRYAENQQVSLSKLIESYLRSLTNESKERLPVSPLVESLTGIIPNDFDEKKN